MEQRQTPDALQGELRTAWHRYVDLIAPLRPALHGYCRRLTSNLWDAEDLVQDTLLRSFAHLALLNHEIRNPRAYLLRTATNVWIDELRRRDREVLTDTGSPDDAPEPGAAPAASSDLRDAGARLLQRLSPQERAAIVLKEIFDMRLEEIATVLNTSTGAVKAALHRGRERLRAPEDAAASRRPVPSAELIDRFIERFNAKDVRGLTELMLAGVAVENVGEALQVGREACARTEHNILYHVVHGHDEWPAEWRPGSVRVERAELDGEPLLLWFVTRREREALEVVFRFEEHQGRIARLRIYGFCPETMRAVGEALGVPVRTGLYRVPLAPGYV